jgi:hypothetical protein
MTNDAAKGLLLQRVQATPSLVVVSSARLDRTEVTYLVMSMNGRVVSRDEYTTVLEAQQRVLCMRRKGWAVVVLQALREEGE